ncbi:urease accessory protein UreD [Microbacterium caowuchunii]|uniref:urease accessory protein UreD n=1 Tax=Microbacterium caowuchunii TaxID=2614638 RepID=UPI001CD478D9|nr:urease accessory protein UreD [Microbacterium caowuchunii]
MTSSALDEAVADDAAVPVEFPGGPRLQAAHFEPSRVPVEVARYGTRAHSLPVGAPGKVGILELDFAVRGTDSAARTEVVHHYQKSPLQIMRPLYYDEYRPDMPYVYVMTAGGGILHNDRQRMDLAFGPGTSAHVTTQAHTKVYRMESGYATSLVNLAIADGAYVEYLPDPVIPYIDARFYQRTAVTLDPGATLVAGETVYAGRLSRGERHAYSAYAGDFEVRRPDGSVVAVDRMRLVPREGRAGGPAVMHGRDVMSSLYVFSPLVGAAEIADALHRAASDVITGGNGAERFGVSILPGDVGAWLRFVGDDTVLSAALHRAATSAVHELLTGRPAPVIRK